MFLSHSWWNVTINWSIAAWKRTSGTWSRALARILSCSTFSPVTWMWEWMTYLSKFQVAQNWDSQSTGWQNQGPKITQQPGMVGWIRMKIIEICILPESLKLNFLNPGSGLTRTHVRGMGGWWGANKWSSMQWGCWHCRLSLVNATGKAAPLCVAQVNGGWKNRPGLNSQEGWDQHNSRGGQYRKSVHIKIQDFV